MFNNEVFPVKEPNHIEDLKRLKLNVNKQHAKCQQQRNKNFEWIDLSRTSAFMDDKFTFSIKSICSRITR